MAHLKEGKIETYFKEQVAEHGGITRKAKWLCRRGCPDQFWAFKRSGRSGLAEIKAPNQPLASHQDREVKRLREAGVEVWVLDCELAVDLFIEKEAK